MRRILSEWRGSSHYRTEVPLIPRPLVRNEARGQPQHHFINHSERNTSQKIKSHLDDNFDVRFPRQTL